MNEKRVAQLAKFPTHVIYPATTDITLRNDALCMRHVAALCQRRN